MPSFDVVSEVELAELTNAVEQARKEIENRYDFKGTSTEVKLEGTTISAATSSIQKLDAVRQIRTGKMSKRGIPLANLSYGEVEGASGGRAKQTMSLAEGVDKDQARKIVKAIKDAKLKVQASIQGETVRVTGKKRDDLQDVIALLKEQRFGVELQYKNFRD